VYIKKQSKYVALRRQLKNRMLKNKHLINGKEQLRAYILPGVRTHIYTWGSKMTPSSAAELYGLPLNKVAVEKFAVWSQ